MAADGHLGMMALSRVTLASAGHSCTYTVGSGSIQEAQLLLGDRATGKHA